MKRNLLVILMILTAGFTYGQTFYWVGNSRPTNTTSFTNNSNWNTALDGSGSARTGSDHSAETLIIDGSNVGGATPQTGQVIFELTATSVGQLILRNNANVLLRRTANSGTSTLTIAGSAGDDLLVDAGSTLSINNNAFAVVFLLTAPTTGRISGTLEIANGPHRFVTLATGGLVIENGGKVYTNISASTYPFGGPQTSQVAARNSVVFESGSHLYFEGGRSPLANWKDYQPVEFKKGSNYHFRASNTDIGVFFSSFSLPNVFIENNSTVETDGPVSRIENLTVEAGSAFVIDSAGSASVTGDVIVNGEIRSADVNGVGGLNFSGETLQTISGTGTVSLGSLTVADGSSLKMAKDIQVNAATHIYGKIDFDTYRLTGAAAFTGHAGANISLTADLKKDTARADNLSAVASTAGLHVTGNGIPANTTVVTHTDGTSSLVLSNPPSVAGTGVALTFTSDTATLSTANISGFENTAGSVSSTGAKNFQPGTGYIINATTTHPFGISSDPGDDPVTVGAVELNAPVTTERSVTVLSGLLLNNKMTVAAGDTLRIAEGAAINGTFGSNNYVAISADAATGAQGLIVYDAISPSPLLIPVGTPSLYLPVTITPAAKGAFRFGVFEGITANGLVNGAPLPDQEKQSKLNGAWAINSVDGISANVQLQWDAAMEGSTFATLPDDEIGMIMNNGTAWSDPLNTADNTNNTTSANLSSFGVFSVGAKAQTEPFVFNEIPVKVYGDPDFNGGASSLNSAKPILYTSSNSAVASIVNGSIHITGAGTATITVTQESDGIFPAVTLDQLLTVSKAALTIKADNKTSPEAETLPALTASYTGFVYGETAAALQTPVVLATTATSSSAPGIYPITASGATSPNYTITFEEGIMTIQPKMNQAITFGSLAAKKYGNADFTISATSNNSTIPVTFSSSNTNVATVTGNSVHIVGAGSAVITASQAGNSSYFPATAAQTLTVDKAALTIAVRDTSKVEGQANPPFTITYTGFVLGETAANLGGQPVVVTPATTGSSAGYYTLTPANATSNNYVITYTIGRLTILPAGGTDQAVLNAYMSNTTVLTTRIYSNAPALSDVVLWDLNGKPLIKRNTFLPKGFISVDLMVGSIPSGVYIVTVRGSGVDLKQMIRIIK